ncbi:MAG: M56 family metallopeptidase, partial [Planctomycetota bacterium]
MSNAITSSADAIVQYLLVASVTAAVLTPLAWGIAKVVKVRAPVYRQLLWLYCLIGIAVLPVVWLYGPKLTLAILPAEVEQLEAVNALEVDSTHKPGLVESPSDESYLLKPTDVEMSAPTNVEEGQPFPANIVLAALWLTGTIPMLARLCAGWYRLRRICVSAMPVSQDNRFGNIDGHILKILVTSQIEGPVCFGVLRPIIMLPRRMYENGTTEGLRMIISHELAHIERRDCWANLYQRLVEAVFFFHPLVWW